MSGARETWRLLGLAPGSDAAAIRRAYAERLRAMDVDADPAGFARLRAARDAALALARGAAVPEEEEAEDAPAVRGADGDIRLPARLRLAPPVLDAPARGVVPAATVAPAPPLPRLTPPVAPGTPRTIPFDSARLRFIAELHDGGGGDIIVRPARGDDLSVHFNTLRLLLDPAHSDTPLTQEEYDHAEAAFDALLADPRLEEIAFRAEAESWFAETLARAVPRADPLLRRAAAAFDWTASAASLHAQPAVAFIAERLAAEDFVAAVAHPAHPHHRAWRLLTDGDHSRRHWFGPPKRRQRALLAEIRQHHPAAEAWLDPYRVAQLDEGIVIAGPPVWVWAILLPALLRFAIGFYNAAMPGFEPSPPRGVAAAPLTPAAPPPPRSDPVADVTALLRSFDPGYDVARLRRENPALLAMLMKRHEELRARGFGGEGFVLLAEPQLRRALPASLLAADDADVRAWRTIERDVLARAMRDKDKTLCWDVMRSDAGTEAQLTQEELARRRALILAILVSDAEAAERSPRRAYTFSIPGDIVEAVIERSGLDETAVTRAFDQEGAPTTQCLVRKALLDAALEARGKEGRKLLRQM